MAESSINHMLLSNNPANENEVPLHGHRPEFFKGQKGAILNLLLKNRGQWVPAYRLAGIALQDNARVKDCRDLGYVIENKTERVGRQMHGSFRFVSCPNKDCQ